MGSCQLLLRSARIEDAEAIAAIYAPFVLSTPVSFEEEPPTVKETELRIGAILARYPYLVAEGEGRLLGFAYASEHRARASYRWSVDTTIYLAPEARGQGIGTELYAELLSILAQLGYRNALAGITQPNAASVALHFKLGYELVGTYRRIGYKRGDWHDVNWYQKVLDSSGTEPQEPGAVP